ncbi:MAG: acyl-CoA dehydratase activase [Thermodesulfovibrionales bacterium]|nr:acyl-CoA dehydratase activase [Thermodesulfovibrionales bacterium]
MRIGGIDIGSRYIKYVLLEGNSILDFKKRETGHNPLSVCKELLTVNRPEKIVATGYGRYLLEVFGDIRTITEIKAVAKGVKAIFPLCRTIIDIGGQDTKVISLSDQGSVVNFEMNDRCAAGTGRFIEIMSRALGYDLDHFGASCNSRSGNVKINSMCTVFAESEVISLIAKGEKREVIAYSIHDSIASKVISMVKRIDIQDDIVFAGGCARNPCLRRILEERLQKTLYVHENPYMHAAYGAALYADI